MSQDTGEQKNLPPSDRKLEKAREKGDFDRSQDVTTAVVIIGLMLLFFFGRGYFAERFDRLFDTAAAAAMSGETRSIDGFEAMWRAVIEILAPVMAVATAATFIGAIMANRGMVVSIHPVLPNLSRINPVEGFKKLFSLRNLIEFIKSFVKTGLFLGACVFILWAALDSVMRTPLCRDGCVGVMAWAILTPLFAVAALFFIVSALLDAPLQTWLFRRDKRMTHTEYKRERKEQYGDPIIRGYLRRMRREMVTGTGGGDVGPGVAFVVADGADGAVLMTYDAKGDGVPIVRRKAKGRRAAAMLDDADARRRPIIQDAPLAQVLLTDTPVGRTPAKAHFNQLARLMIRAGVIGG